MSLSRASSTQSHRLHAEGLKLCGRCQEVKPHSAFGRSSARWDGFQGHCRICRTRNAPPAATWPERVVPPPAPRKPAKTREDYLREQADAREALRAHWALNDAYAVEGLKACSSCKQERPRQDFSTNPSNRDGLNSVCRPCDSDRRSARRARLRGVWVEDVDRTVLWHRDGGICYLCGLPADPAQWDVDHVHPICHGSEHSYANTAVTHPSCNRSKNGEPWPDVHFDPAV